MAKNLEFHNQTDIILCNTYVHSHRKSNWMQRKFSELGSNQDWNCTNKKKAKTSVSVKGNFIAFFLCAMWNRIKTDVKKNQKKTISFIQKNWKSFFIGRKTYNIWWFFFQNQLIDHIDWFTQLLKQAKFFSRLRCLAIPPSVFKRISDMLMKLRLLKIFRALYLDLV